MSTNPKRGDRARGEEPSPSPRGRGKGRPLGIRKPRTLRIATADEALLAVVRPFISGVDTDADLIYHIWQPGLDIQVGQLLSMGVPLPPGYTEEAIALRIAQHVVLCMPLLRRTGKLALLGINEGVDMPPIVAPPPHLEGNGEIDPGASDIIASMGADDFI